MHNLYIAQVSVGDSVVYEGRLRVVTAIYEKADGTYRFRLDGWEIVPVTECSVDADDMHPLRVN